MLGIGAAVVVLMLIAPAVAIISTRNAVWLIAVPFWAVRVRIDDLASVASVDVRPLEDFGGWGVKGASRRKGLLFAANGQHAVQITRVNGQVLLATSEDPARAIAAITAMTAMAAISKRSV